MQRAVKLFEAQGLVVIPAPVDFSVTQRDWEIFWQADWKTQLINLAPSVGSLIMDNLDDERIFWHPGIRIEGLAMNKLMDKRRILLGVTGSIAAYKAVELASKLTQAGAWVDVILTQAAEAFVRPLTFQSVTGRKAFCEADLWGAEGHVQHIGLAKNAELFLIAPATANTLAKLAHGQADNLLTVTALAAVCPILIAPAMDGGMYRTPGHPAQPGNSNQSRRVDPGTSPRSSGIGHGGCWAHAGASRNILPRCAGSWRRMER